MRAPVLSSPTVAVYGSRNCAPPLKRLVTFTRLLHRLYDHHRHRRLSVKLSTLSSFHRSGDDLSLLFTGNCPFFRMEQFWTASGTNRNNAMVENLQRYGVISLKKVVEVMEALDRALFVPDGAPAYVDSPIPIGYNATISAPHMHATCLQLLEKNLQPGMRALDVGSGTGYLTACFALMVGPEGRAVGVEHISELVDASIKNIEQSGAAPLLKKGSLSVHVGDGRKGWPEFAPYDAIHVGAAASDIPQALLDQLKPGGRMVIPVGNFFQDLKVVDKNTDGSISIHSETSVRYVPLTSREEQLRGH